MNSLRTYFSLPSQSQQTWLRLWGGWSVKHKGNSSGQSFMGFMSQNCRPRVIQLYSVCFYYNNCGRKRYKWLRGTQWKHYMKSTPRSLSHWTPTGLASTTPALALIESVALDMRRIGHCVNYGLFGSYPWQQALRYSRRMLGMPLVLRIPCYVQVWLIKHTHTHRARWKLLWDAKRNTGFNALKKMQSENNESDRFRIAWHICY